MFYKKSLDQRNSKDWKTVQSIPVPSAQKKDFNKVPLKVVKKEPLSFEKTELAFQSSSKRNHSEFLNQKLKQLDYEVQSKYDRKLKDLARKYQQQIESYKDRLQMIEQQHHQEKESFNLKYKAQELQWKEDQDKHKKFSKKSSQYFQKEHGSRVRELNLKHKEELSSLEKNIKKLLFQISMCIKGFKKSRVSMKSVF